MMALRVFALRAGLFLATLFVAARFGREAAVLRLFFEAVTFWTLFFGASFLTAPAADFFALTAGLTFLTVGRFFAITDFFAFCGLGAAVIRPGRAGFREGDFLPLIARICFDADERLLVALVLRLLINLLELRMNYLHV
jgi:hypothetical protein